LAAPHFHWANTQISPPDRATFGWVKIADGVQAQNIEITSRAVNLKTGANSSITNWRDGTNLTQALNAKFLAIPSIQSPAIGATNVSTWATLSWKGVPGARLYATYIVDAKTQALVWLAYTERTSISLPYELAANTKYIWGVDTDDSYSLGDIFGTSPTTIAAGQWLNTDGIFKLRGRNIENAMNTWRGNLAAGYLERDGALPSAGIGKDTRPGQGLTTRGFRSSSSESASFTTGK
jgi:hypothetical protein